MGVIKHYLTIDGVSSEDFNIWISGGATFDSPKRDYETVQVPGRDGDLVFDNGRYENQSLKYPAFITRDFKKNIDNFTDFISSLRGYKRLEDTYHPDEYLMALFSDGVKVKNFEIAYGGGDCVYVGSRNCRNVVLEDLDCHHG